MKSWIVRVAQYVIGVYLYTQREEARLILSFPDYPHTPTACPAAFPSSPLRTDNHEC